MAQTKVAKLFRNGASQAVRLPSEFRFEGTEVYVSRDRETGDVILSTRPGAQVWSDFFHSHPDAEAGTEFLPKRPMNRPPVEKDLFTTKQGRQSDSE
jgi:antitoxin VapB